MPSAPPDLPWAGRTVVVTGSTLGIGAATADLFAADGAHVVIHGIEAALGDKSLTRLTDAGQQASLVVSDLRDPAACQALIDHAIALTGRLDVLIANAGATAFAGVAGADLEDWNACLDLDLRAVWLTTKAAAAVMHSAGSIVTVASNHATATIPGAFPYNVAKAGVVALTQSLALEFARNGIRANAVCPGYIDTGRSDYFAGFADPEAERERVRALHPVGRLGRPTDVARAIRFLADDTQSGFVTGTCLTVDGGRSALLQDPAETGGIS